MRHTFKNAASDQAFSMLKSQKVEVKPVVSERCSLHSAKIILQLEQSEPPPELPRDALWKMAKILRTDRRPNTLTAPQLSGGTAWGSGDHEVDIKPALGVEISTSIGSRARPYSADTISWSKTALNC